jgi:hypothetical protein
MSVLQGTSVLMNRLYFEGPLTGRSRFLTPGDLVLAGPGVVFGRCEVGTLGSRDFFSSALCPLPSTGPSFFPA